MTTHTSTFPVTATPGPTFSLEEMPFSTRGAWINLSPTVGHLDVREDVHLVSHKHATHPVLRLQTHGPAGVHGTWVGTPGVLTWSAGDAVLQCAFQDTSTIRVRGRGAALTIHGISCEMYQSQTDDSFVFAVNTTGRRYRVTLLDAEMTEFSRLYDRTIQTQPWIRVGRESGAEWEIAIQEFDSDAPVLHDVAPFADVVGAQEKSFATWRDLIAPWRTEQTPGVELAVYVDWCATVDPDGFFRRPAMLMSKHWMDKVWSWDHCFNALAIAEDASAAWDQYVIMFDHQDPNGMIPDSIAHSELLYNYPKPPIHGWALGQLLELIAEQPSAEELRRIRDALERWTHWWQTTMTVPGQALAFYHFGNDSGWDNATIFDGDAPLQMPDLQAFLVLQMETIATLADREGDTAGAAQWRARAAQQLDVLLRELWDGEKFIARQARTNRVNWSECLLLAMPIVLGRRLPTEVIDSLVTTIRRHLTAFGLATEQTDSPKYESDGYWRGPIWAPSTYLIVWGLREAGQTELADEISARYRALCERSGFAENFEALTGQGLRDRAYTWTASCYLLLAKDAVTRP